MTGMHDTLLNYGEMDLIDLTAYILSEFSPCSLKYASLNTFQYVFRLWMHYAMLYQHRQQKQLQQLFFRCKFCFAFNYAVK